MLDAFIFAIYMLPAYAGHVDAAPPETYIETVSRASRLINDRRLNIILQSPPPSRVILHTMPGQAPMRAQRYQLMRCTICDASPRHLLFSPAILFYFMRHALYYA